MEISSHTNSYQALNSYQQRKDDLVTLPVEPQDPKYNSKEVYEASQGNLISDRDGEVSITPQGQTNLNAAVEEQQTELATAQEDKKDAQRGVAVDHIARQSTKSQVEIYLSVASDGEVDVGNDTASIIESLRDVQKQNNAVEAYATYKQNQNSSQLGFVS